MARLAALLQRRQQVHRQVTDDLRELNDIDESRRLVQRRVTEGMREIASIDRVLLPRVERMVAAAEGLDQDVQLDDDASAPSGAAPPTLTRGAHVATVEGRGDAVLRQRVREVHERVRTVRETVRDLAGNMIMGPQVAQSVPEGDDRKISAFIVSEVSDVLMRRGAPMKLADIYQELVGRGHFVGGKNPVNNLSAHLSNNRDTFVRTGYGWALRNSRIQFPGPRMVSSIQARTISGRVPGEDGDEMDLVGFDPEDLPRGE